MEAESDSFSMDCPECGSDGVVRDTETGELVCKACGYVLSEDSMDRGPDWRAYTLEERNSLPRAGSPLTLTMHDRGMSTMIGKGRDYLGNSIRGEKRYKYLRLRKWNRRFKTSGSRERNLSRALAHMNRSRDRLNLPENVMETAAKVYRQALEKDLVRGRSIEGIALVSVYIACRKCGVVRRLDTIAEGTRLSTKRLSRTYRHLYWHIDAEIPLTDHYGCISKISSKLGVYGGAERIAKAIMEQAIDSMLTVGRQPTSTASACIYISSRIMGLEKTQREISEASNVTEVTIRNRYREIIEELDITIRL